MFGSNVLDVAIGLIFIYLLISLICSVINEAISSLLNKRGTNLFLGVKNLLNDPDFTGLAQQVYNHGMIDGISQEATNPKKINRKPSYIPALNFSLALIDILGARGAVDAVYGPLLDAAEQADDDAQATPTVATDAARKAARAALENAANEAAVARREAERALAANPRRAPFVQAAKDARRAADTAMAAVAMHNARRAAVALAKNPKNVELANRASDTLEIALAAGRALNANFPHSSPLTLVQAAVKRLPPGHTRESLAVLIDKTKRELKAGEDEIEQYRINLESWFNDAMDRVSGWYKRWTQWVLFCVALVVVCLANVDTIHIVQRLTSDTALRGALVTAAEDASKRPTELTEKNSKAADTSKKPAKPAKADADTSKTPGAPSAEAVDQVRLQNVLTTAKSLQLPLGWSMTKADPEYYKDFLSLTHDGPRRTLPKILGLLVTVLAVSLGAPFWFDILSKFVNLRSAGTPPGEKSKSAPKATLPGSGT